MIIVLGWNAKVITVMSTSFRMLAIIPSSFRVNSVTAEISRCHASAHKSSVFSWDENISAQWILRELARAPLPGLPRSAGTLCHFVQNNLTPTKTVTL